MTRNEFETIVDRLYLENQKLRSLGFSLTKRIEWAAMHLFINPGDHDENDIQDVRNALRSLGDGGLSFDEDVQKKP